MSNAAQALQNLGTQLAQQAQAAAAQQNQQANAPAPDANQLARAFDQASQAAQAQSTQAASQSAQAAAQALSQAAQTAAQQAGVPTSAMTSQSTISPPSQGARGMKYVDGGEGEVPEKLKRLGIATEDWLRLPTDLRNQILQAAQERAPQEYRTLVKRYFRELAKRGSSHSESK